MSARPRSGQSTVTAMKVFGNHEEKTLDQMAKVAEGAEHAALMADGHFGYGMPIGGVAAYRDKVSPTGVGFDIACGNYAVKLDVLNSATCHDDLLELGHNIQNSFAFGVGRQNEHPDAPTEHPLFDDDRWNLIPELVTKRNGKQFGREMLREKARQQLGSIGSGNHYIDIFAGDDGHLWVGVHFGSRGFGHTIATWGMAAVVGDGWGDPAQESYELFDLDTQVGRDYWDLMQLAGQYAYAGRDWVCRAVAELMDAEILDTVHNNHNFAWREYHRGEGLVVVRKGATPAQPGQRGFVGGSMGDDAVILHGSGIPHVAMDAAVASLFSTVHGAGRVMSRTAATGRNRRGKKIGEPRVDIVETLAWLKERGVLVFGADLDEAPGAYRRLPDVLAEQGDTIVVETTLSPLVVVMAAENKADRNPFLV